MSTFNTLSQCALTVWEDAVAVVPGWWPASSLLPLHLPILSFQ